MKKRKKRKEKKGYCTHTNGLDVEKKGEAGEPQERQTVLGTVLLHELAKSRQDLQYTWLTQQASSRAQTRG